MHPKPQRMRKGPSKGRMPRETKRLQESCPGKTQKSQGQERQLTQILEQSQPKNEGFKPRHKPLKVTQGQHHTVGDIKREKNRPQHELL